MIPEECLRILKLCLRCCSRCPILLYSYIILLYTSKILFNRESVERVLHCCLLTDISCGKNQLVAANIHCVKYVWENISRTLGVETRKISKLKFLSYWQQRFCCMDMRS